MRNEQEDIHCNCQIRRWGVGVIIGMVLVSLFSFDIFSPVNNNDNNNK